MLVEVGSLGIRIWRIELATVVHRRDLHIADGCQFSGAEYCVVRHGINSLGLGGGSFAEPMELLEGAKRLKKV